MGIEIDEAAIPVAEPVAAACELLGLDPLYVANEGRLVAFVPACVRRSGVGGHASPSRRRRPSPDRRRHRQHTPARWSFAVRFGGGRIVDLLSGEQMPRIC